MHEEIQKIKNQNYKHVSYHIKHWQNKDELKNQNISGVKNQKRNGKTYLVSGTVMSTQPD
jgi:hypothetical protein